MKKLIFLIGMLMIIIAPSIAICGAAPQGDYPVLAQQSQGGSQTQSQPMTRSQDWPNVQGSGPPYGTPAQKSTTPGYPRPQEQQGLPYGSPVTPESRQQGGSDMGSQGWPNVEGHGVPYGTPTQKSTTPGYPRPQEQQGLPYGSPVTPESRQQGGSDMGSQGWPNIEGQGLHTGLLLKRAQPPATQDLRNSRASPTALRLFRKDSSRAARSQGKINLFENEKAEHLPPFLLPYMVFY